uniref:Dienelactone hydrolase domain-containing protein n=1 Tax=Hemiselmis andersenii TaxID=464988 RepID=A0A6U4MRY9_HEMAN|mmetsp:Transcript_21100/g.48423  ORF Transcript_21100/g.48423 Transcript_21100/m.48423 type:complete len:321 (+) Transcript_21100:46-1008(+)
MSSSSAGITGLSVVERAMLAQKTNPEKGPLYCARRPYDGQGSVRQFKDYYNNTAQAGGAAQTMEMMALSQAGSKPMTAAEQTAAVPGGITAIPREDGTDVPAYTSAPVPGGPGIVVIQEWWGVNDQVKATAGDMAAACGAAVAVPDLYRGQLAYEAAEANHIMSGLDWGGALQDVRACARWLKQNGCSKVTVIGFCMGGALALGSGVVSEEVDACIAFYGWNGGLADVSQMRKPTQCHFGDLDEQQGFSDKETADKLEAELARSGCPLEFYRYPTQGHGFMNNTQWGREMQARLGRPEVEVGEIQAAMGRVKAFVAAHGT